MVHFRRDFWARRWSVTSLNYVYTESRRFIFSNGGGLGSKSAFFFEILAVENGLFLNENPPYLDSRWEYFNHFFTNNIIF
jgi:hypothetical protein